MFANAEQQKKSQSFEKKIFETRPVLLLFANSCWKRILKA